MRARRLRYFSEGSQPHDFVVPVISHPVQDQNLPAGLKGLNYNIADLPPMKVLRASAARAAATVFGSVQAERRSHRGSDRSGASAGAVAATSGSSIPDRLEHLRARQRSGRAAGSVGSREGAERGAVRLCRRDQGRGRRQNPPGTGRRPRRRVAAVSCRRSPDWHARPDRGRQQPLHPLSADRERHAAPGDRGRRRGQCAGRPAGRCLERVPRREVRDSAAEMRQGQQRQLRDTRRLERTGSRPRQRAGAARESLRYQVFRATRSRTAP